MAEDVNEPQLAGDDKIAVRAQEPLEQAVAQFLEEVAAGRAPDRGQLLADYPDVADELQEFLGQHDRLRKLAGPWADEMPPCPAPSVSPVEEPEEPQASSTTLGAGSTDGPKDLTADRVQLEHKIRDFGDYVLLEVIGRGGMGIVYRARQLSLNRIVALKMILAGQLASEDDVKRFQVEAEAAANLDHPGIVPIYQVGRHEGQHYFSMGYVEGESLAAKLAAGPLLPREGAELIMTVAQAIHYAHQKGIVHRDLKPANILLDSERQPRITDFGLAKRVEGGSDLTGTGQILGTPSFMPLEQAAGQLDHVGPAVDVYALGAVLYSILVGRPPFQAAISLDTLLQVREQEPVSPRELNAEVPRDLETIILKCLAKDPRRRYSSAEALADDLSRWLSGEPIQARRTSIGERGFKWVKRRPAISTLTAALVLVAATGFAGILSHWRKAETAREAAVHARWHEQRQKKEAEANAELAAQQRAEAIRARDSEQKLRELAEARELEARRHLYAAHMNLLQQAWERADVERVMQLLEFHRPAPHQKDLRGFEWYYFERLCHRETRVFEGHDRHINAVAFSPDGKKLASGSWDNTARVWDVSTGKTRAVLTDGAGHVSSLAFAPDGKILAAGKGDETVRLWEVSTGRQLKTFKLGTSVYCVIYHPGGELLAVGCHGGTHLLNIETGQERAFFKGRSAVDSVAFSPDGRMLAARGEDWDDIQVWDVASQQPLATLPDIPGLLKALAFSPDGRILAADSNNRAILWDTGSWEEKAVLMGHKDNIRSLAFASDGKTLATASNDQTVKLWNVDTGTEQASLNTGLVYSVAFSPHGTQLATGGRKAVKLWPAEQQVWSTVQGPWHGRPVAYCPISRTVVIAPSEGSTLNYNEVLFVDAATGQPRCTLKLNPDHLGLYGSKPMFSPDGRLLATISYGDMTAPLAKPKTCEVAIWRVADGRQVTILKGKVGVVLSLAFSPEGNKLATGDFDGTVKLWETTSGKELRLITREAGRVQSVSFSPDGQILATAAREVKLWNPTTGKPGITLAEKARSVDYLAFSPDGKLLATAGASKVIDLWDVSTGKKSVSLRGYEASTVAFSPCGRRLASTSGHVVVWDIATGHELLMLHTRRARLAAFSPDGDALTLVDHRTVKIYRAAPRQINNVSREISAQRCAPPF